MALSMAAATPCLSLPFPPSPHLPRAPPFFLILGRNFPIISASSPRSFVSARASSDDGGGGGNVKAASSSLLNDELLRRASGVKDADQVLDLLAEENRGRGCRVVGTEDCCSIIEAALERNNADLALSVYSAMCSAIVPGESENGSVVERWKWVRPDVRTHAVLVRGLAASLRVSDAIKAVGYISRMGASEEEEVPFGKIVRCPMCTVAIAVAQPQHGIQAASCSKCRYKYELVSGDIVSIESEEVRFPTFARRGPVHCNVPPSYRLFAFIRRRHVHWNLLQISWLTAQNWLPTFTSMHYTFFNLVQVVS